MNIVAIVTAAKRSLSKNEQDLASSSARSSRSSPLAYFVFSEWIMIRDDPSTSCGNIDSGSPRPRSLLCHPSSLSCGTSSPCRTPL